MVIGAKIILNFIIFTLIVGMFSMSLNGCTRHQPKAYVCVEKAPLKVTYIDYHKDISPATIDMLIQRAKHFKDSDYPLNNSNTVVIGYDAKVEQVITPLDIGD